MSDAVSGYCPKACSTSPSPTTQRLLTARLPATPPGTDCVLSDAEEAAHGRTANRMNHMSAHGSGIDRYLY